MITPSSQWDDPVWPPGANRFGWGSYLGDLTEAQIAHAGIGRKFQKPTIFENHSVFENLELALKTDKGVKADSSANSTSRRGVSREGARTSVAATL